MNGSDSREEQGGRQGCASHPLYVCSKYTNDNESVVEHSCARTILTRERKRADYRHGAVRI